MNINEEHELRRWSEKFGVPPDRLREIVRRAGPAVDDVEAELRRSGGRIGR